jgi:hypothetical protein
MGHNREQEDSPTDTPTVIQQKKLWIGQNNSDYKIVTITIPKR